jgi:FtsH-binding integral membrane protein
VTFIRRTYAHLAGAILAFAGIEALLLMTSLGQSTTLALLSMGKFGILLYLLLFMGAGTMANAMAHARDRSSQYLGLGLFVLLQAIICLPLLYIAAYSSAFAGQHIIAKAGLMTLGVFAGLSMAVFVTRQDFSYLGPILCVVTWLAIAAIFAAIIFGFDLGLWFSFALLALAAAYIIYDTSNVLHHYATDQYVGASLQLFASVALLFRVILRILMESRRN